MKRALLAALLFALPGLAAEEEPAPAEEERPAGSEKPAKEAPLPHPTGLEARWREGQVFLTWKEAEEDADGKPVRHERYRVYRSAQPITDVKAEGVECVALVDEGSARWRLEGDDRLERRSRDEPLTRAAHGYRRLCVKAGAELGPGTGVVVLTTREPGRYHYAVTTAKKDKESAGLVPGENVTAEAVEEEVAPPGCILLKKLSDSAWYFIQYGDYERLNPSGEDRTWLGYACGFLVTVPEGYDTEKREPIPLQVRLHGFGGTGADDKETPGHAGRVAMLLPQDYGNTWWYGCADGIPPAGPEALKEAKGIVRPYTRERVLAALDWLLRAPANCPVRIDPEHVSLYGHSMGGYGALSIALARPGLFSGALGTKMPFAFPDAGPWSGFTAPLWGTRKQRLRTPEGAAALEALALARQAGAPGEGEPPLLEISVSRCDWFAPARPLADLAAALERSRVPYFAHWGLYSHSGGRTSGARVRSSAGTRAGTPLALAFEVTRGESVLALANASANGSLGRAPDISGNSYVECTDTTLRVGRNVELAVGGEAVPFEGWRRNELRGRKLVLWPKAGAPEFTIASNTEDAIAIGGKGLLEAARARRLSDAAFLVFEGDASGYLNAAFEWSCRANDFDPASKADDIVDEEKRYEVSLRLARGCDAEFKPGDASAEASVDVTPRRTRKFRPEPRARVYWENVSLADPAKPTVVDRGRVHADRSGLVTVERFKIGKKGLGNRLVLTVR